jgi:hypothetical protein
VASAARAVGRHEQVALIPELCPACEPGTSLARKRGLARVPFAVPVGAQRRNVVLSPDSSSDRYYYY